MENNNTSNHNANHQYSTQVSEICSDNLNPNPNPNPNPNRNHNHNHNILSLCQNARLSLQNAASSRRSHMLSEELQCLQNFEVLTSKTIPQHPLYSSKREEKQILELNFYLPDVRKRISELEGKHPSLSKNPKPPKFGINTTGLEDHERVKKSTKLSDKTGKRLDNSREIFENTAETPENTTSNEARKPPKKKKVNNVSPRRPSSSLSARTYKDKGSRSLTPPLEPRRRCNSPKLYNIVSGKNSYPDHIVMLLNSSNSSPPRSRSRSPLVIRTRTSLVPSNGIRKFAPSGLDKFGMRKLSTSVSFESNGIKTRNDVNADTRFTPRTRHCRTTSKSPKLVENDESSHRFDHSEFMQSDMGVRRRSTNFENYADEVGFPSPHIPSCAFSSSGDDDDGSEGWKTIASHGSTKMKKEEEGETYTSQPFSVIESDNGDSEDLGKKCKDYEDDSRRNELMRSAKCWSHDHVSSLELLISKAKSRIGNLVVLPAISSNQLSDGENTTSPLSPHRTGIKSAFSRSKESHEKNRKDDQHVEKDPKTNHVEKHKRTDQHVEKHQKADRHVKKHKKLEAGNDTDIRKGYQDLGSAFEHFHYGRESNESNNSIKHISKNDAKKLDQLPGLMSTENLEEALKRLGSLHEESEEGLRALRTHSIMKEKENQISSELASRVSSVEVPSMKMEATTDSTRNVCSVASSKSETLFNNDGGVREKDRDNIIGCLTGTSWPRSHHQNFEDSECEAIRVSDSKVSFHGEAIREDNANCLQGRSWVVHEENNSKNKSNNLDAKAQCEESMTYVEDEEVAMRDAAVHEHSKGIEPQKNGSQKTKNKATKKKKKVKFNDEPCRAHTEIEDDAVVIERRDPSLHEGQIQQKAIEHIKQNDNDDEKLEMDHHQLHRKQRFMTSSSFKTISRPILDPYNENDEAFKSSIGNSSNLLIQERIDSWLSRIETELKNQVDEAVADSMKKIEVSLKVNIANLEVQRMHEVMGNLKKEINSNLHESKKELRHVEGKLQKISHFMDQTGEQLHIIREDGLQCRSRLDGMKKETDAQIDGIRLSMEKLSAQNGIRLEMEKLNIQAVKECKEKVVGLESFQEIQNKEKTDMKNMLNSLEKSREEGRSELEAWKEFKDELKRGRSVLKCDVVLKNMVESLIGSWIGHCDTEASRNLQDDVEKDRLKSELDLENRVRNLEKWWEEGKYDVDALKKFKNKLEEDQHLLNSEAKTREGTMVTEKVEVSSQVYLGGLDEDRTGVKDIKVYVQKELDRNYEDIRQKTGEPTNTKLLNSMEARILEQAKDIKIHVQKEIDRSYADLRQKQEETTIARFLNGMEIRILELEKGQKCTQAIQDGLTCEKSKSSFLFVEMMEMTADIRKERDRALTSASEAKERIREVVQNFEHESERLRDIQSKIEKEKDVVIFLSEEISDSAMKAKNVLHDMDELRKKSMKLSDEVLSELNQIKMKNESTNHRYEDIYTKVESLEGSQLGLCSKIGEVKDKTDEIEKSVAQWFPKYEAAATVLHEVENRLEKLEACGRDDEKRVLDKDSFVSLYKDLLGLRNPDELSRWSALQCRRTRSSLDTREKFPFLILDSRIEHVATATYTNLRILDMKVELMNRNLETTLKCATSAEKKCNLLGAEIIKVFRMLANASKTDTEKLHLSPSRGTHMLKTEVYPLRRKNPLSTTRLNQKKHLIPSRDTKHTSVRGVKICEKNDLGSDNKDKVAKRNKSCGKNSSTSGNKAMERKAYNVVH